MVDGDDELCIMNWINSSSLTFNGLIIMLVLLTFGEQNASYKSAGGKLAGTIYLRIHFFFERLIRS